MARLAGHPVANFVCARVVERANEEQTQAVIDEIPAALEGIIENSRTGVLKALLEKSAEYHVGEEALNKVHHTILPLWNDLCTDCIVFQALLDAFQTTTADDIQYLIPCALSLMTLKVCSGAC